MRGSGDERGATATIIAILLSGGVVMGMLAVSVDLGNLTYERRQLQNAADATSLALAAECAKDSSACSKAQVADLLDANSRDGVSQYDTAQDDGACARTATTNLPACTSTGAIDDLGACPPLPGWLSSEPGIPYVETYAKTDTLTNGDKLFMPFSRVLAGGASGDKGTSACARAAWGTPGGFAGALPLTFSSCEWRKQVVTGPGYVTEAPIGATATIPGYGSGGQPAWPDAAKEVVVMLHDPNDEAGDCMWNGKDTSGGFGWLAPKSGQCEADLKPDDWVQIKPGSSIPSPECSTNLSNIRHRVVDFPVFDCIVGSGVAPTGPPPTTPADACDPKTGAAGGSKSWYHLAGWAKFYISGYRLTGSDSGTSSRPGGKSCSGGQRCIIGWFLTGTLADAPSIVPSTPGNNFGVSVVKPAG